MKHWRGWLIFAFVLFVLFFVFTHSFVFMSVGGLLALIFILGVCVFTYTKFFSKRDS